MPGMNNLSGKPVADIAHLSQSIADILTTPLGTRLERRTYGSLLPELIDHPDNGTTRVRMVEYSPGYLADHWCWRGHVLLCLEGELQTELEDGRQFTLTAGMSYQVGNDRDGHRSSTATGARLFIVD